MINSKILLLYLIVICSFGIPAQASTVNLSIAASMSDAFQEIIIAYQTKYPDVKIQPNFSSSGALAKQITQGAPAHIYVSANPKWMAYLVEKEMIVESLNRVFAFNKLVFLGSANDKITKVDDVITLQLIGIGSPMSVPAGEYAKQAMERVGIYKQLQQAGKLVMAKDVRQALLYADRGEVDGSFVYQTDAVLAQNSNILFIVPRNLYGRVSYSIGLTLTGADKEAALSFYNFTTQKEVVKILQKYGFKPVQ